MNDPTERMKRQATKWEKIFANHLSEKQEYKKKKLSKLNSKKTLQLENRSRYKENFLKVDREMSHKHMKTDSTSLSIVVVVVQVLSCVQPFAIPWTTALQASLSFIISQSLL